MFEIDLVETCGGMLSLALEESLGKGDAAVIGPSAKKMKFLDWKPDVLDDPLALDASADYDFVACVQCLPQLRGLKLINIDNKLYAAKAGELVDLTKEQSRQANAFMKRSGLTIPRGTTAVIPLELHNFLGKAEKSLKPNGKLLFLDYGPTGVFENLTLMQARYMPLSRFFAGTSAGKMHVINCNKFLAHSPHSIRDASVISLLEKHDCGNKLVPWLDIKEKLSAGERDVLEPFLTRVSSVFSGWSSLVKDYKTAAKTTKKLLESSDGVTELYSTLFIVSDTVSTGFVETAWSRANEIAGLPDHPEFFAALLTKGI
ncbi:MAG: hypothetical protein KAW41_02630 [Candidatus Diapherotrites archaeon]|nr:hypothetical protein [Candidatus Diapherotrites archaeon]